MAWTAKIPTGGIVKNKLSFNVTVEFYKDDILFDTDTVKNINPLDSVYGWIDTRIGMYKKVDETDIVTPIGDVNLTPTQEELDKKAIEAKYIELLQAEKNLALKVITQQEYDTILAEYKTLITS